MPIVLGLDSSTQSLSGVILNTGTGRIIAEDSVNFGKDLPHYGQPSGYDPNGKRGEVHANPLMWVEALDLLLTRMKAAGVDFGQVEAVSGSGQQHGSVYLKSCFGAKLAELSPSEAIKDQIAGCLTRSSSPIWMDSSTPEECVEIANAVGGDEVVCAKSGSIAVERFTGSQIRNFFKSDPEAYEATGIIHLVSSFFASILAGKNVAIDHGDGAGMNLMNLASGNWDNDLLAATACDLESKLPPVAPSGTSSGKISTYFVEKYGFSNNCETVIWSGDNPCSLVGMGAATPGKVVISLGTSDTLFAAMPEPKTDPQGFGHAFGNPMGGYMSLICFKNGSLAREAVKKQFDLEWSAFEKAGLAATPVGNGGLMMLPFYEPEITPRLDTGGAVFSTEGEHTAAETVRAVLECQFLNMRQHFRWLDVEPTRISLTGGASENDGIAQVIANVFGVPVDRLDVPGSAAVGAGMRAACILGVPLEELESKFSVPREGSTIVPEEGAHEIYDEMQDRFAEFLARQ
ncbi:FGGY-family carbohydrate kinase [Verrucomicrobiaceae bacterium 227]